MNDTLGDQKSDQDLAQTAVKCYLSTILSTTECIAAVFPSVGIPYHNRWRRMPQRIGFDMSARSLEASAQMFQAELTSFAELANRLFGDGLNLVQGIGSQAQRFESALEETAPYANLLDELAESLEQAADLNEISEIGDMLLLQSEGPRKAARQLRNRLLPLLQNMSVFIRECRRIQLQIEQDLMLDRITGFVNGRGFRHALKCRYEEPRDCCVLLIDCIPKLETGRECSEEEFNQIAGDVAGRLGDQFRPWDCLGRIGPRRMAVIFEGSKVVAIARSEQISRSISGGYSYGISVTATIRVMDRLDADSLLAVLSVADKTAVSPNPAAALAVA